MLSVTSLDVTLTGLYSSTLDVGLPSVSRHFAATPGQVSWFLLSYMLVSTVLILTFGRLADLLARRLLYVAPAEVGALARTAAAPRKDVPDWSSQTAKSCAGAGLARPLRRTEDCERAGTSGEGADHSAP